MTLNNYGQCENGNVYLHSALGYAKTDRIIAIPTTWQVGVIPFQIQRVTEIITQHICFFHGILVY